VSECKPRRIWDSPQYHAVAGRLALVASLAHRLLHSSPVPFFVEHDFRAFLDRGAPFSCKGHGFCPSCRGRLKMQLYVLSAVSVMLYIKPAYHKWLIISMV